MNSLCAAIAMWLNTFMRH